jgi:hypothetical protein
VGLDEERLPAGIVFRRLDTPAERSRARGLLGAGGPVYRSPRLCGDEPWAGLWNLTAANSGALAAAASTVRMSARVVEVRAMVVPADGHRSALCGRLVRELADVCRARGAEWMVAGIGKADVVALDLLRHMGFDTVTAANLDVPEPGAVVWLALQV